MVIVGLLQFCTWPFAYSLLILKLNNIFGIIYSFKEITWKCESFYIMLVLIWYSQYSKILHIRWDIWYSEKNPLFKFWISKIFYEEGSWKCWMPFWHLLKNHIFFLTQMHWFRTRWPLLDGWMASPTRWTWLWVNSGTWWWTGRPGMLQCMGLQRVGHDWATDLIW